MNRFLMTGKQESMRQKLEWALDAFSLCAVLQYCAYRFLQSTLFVFYYSQTYKLITMGLLLVFGGIRYLSLLAAKWKGKRTEERKKFLLRCAGAWGLALPFFYVGWKQDYKFLIFLPICCMCLYDMNPEKICRAFALAIGTLLASTLFCALAGTVQNITYSLEDGRAACSYGIINTTDFASYVVFLLLTAWCGSENHDWRHRLFFAVFTGGITCAVYWLTDSRTALYSGILLSFLMLWDCFESWILRKRRKLRFLVDGTNALAVFSFPLIGLIVVLLVAAYGHGLPSAVQINQALTHRLEIVWNPFQTYGIHPFGSAIESMHGFGGTIVHQFSGGYSYLDIAYAMIAICYGWVISAIIAVLWVRFVVKAISAGRNRIALSMIVLAFHAFSEARILDVNYNIFLLMPFCALPSIPKDERLVCDLRKRELPNLARVAVTGILALLFSILLPQILSWSRTFFSVMEWNRGRKAAGSLLVFIFLFALLYMLRNAILHFQKSKIQRLIVLPITLLFLIAGSLYSDHTIDSAIKNQSLRIEQEKQIIQKVQEAATLPVYSAEAEEIYQREIGGFAGHIFSSEELCRSPQGTLFTDQDVELFTGHWYTQISDWTGVYSFDPAVIEMMQETGYTWTPYYSGLRSCNLSDTARFNQQIYAAGKMIVQGPSQIITTEMETDQLRGTYQVSFTISLDDALKEGETLLLQVLGEKGESTISQAALSNNDFGEEKTCAYSITYQIKDTPKVSYSIVVPENVKIYVENISWQRIS